MSARLKINGLSPPRPKLMKSITPPKVILSSRLLRLPPQKSASPKTGKDDIFVPIRNRTASPRNTAVAMVTVLPRHLSGRDHSKLNSAPLFSW